MNNEATDRTERSVIADDLISAREAGTLWGLFRERARRCPDATAYRDYDPIEGNWRDHTWRSISMRVDRFRAALAQEGLKPSDRVAVLLPNGINWVCLDLAAHASGLIVVGLYPHETAASNAYILGHSEARLLLVDNDARWQSLEPSRSDLASLEYVWICDAAVDPVASRPGPTVRKLAEVLVDATEPPLPQAVAASDLATLIYTSGTTGRPKGVMLSHFALLWNAEASAAIIPPRREDVFLSILPLAHAFERTVGYHLPMMGGCTVAFARSARELREDLAAVRPTTMLGVPLLYERMYEAIDARVSPSYVRLRMLRIAEVLGWRRFEATQQRVRPDFATRLLWPMLKQYVAAPVLAAFGGRIRVAISGGAPLDQSVARRLIGLGLPLIEGYGLTEAAPVVAANALDDNLPGSVGRPLQGIEVKLTSEGELLVRSPSTMSGYWKDEAETERLLDPMGWLSTGDIVEIKDGRIFIRGRANEIIVLSIGEKVTPSIVEAEITRDPLFEQAIVVGNRRPYLVALIVLNAANWSQFAKVNRIAPNLPNQPASKMRVMPRLASRLSGLPRFAQVRAVHLTLTPWTIDAGLLTSTSKIRRDALQRQFAKEIDALYTEH